MKTEDKNIIILDDSSVFETWTLTNKLRYKRIHIINIDVYGNSGMTEILELQQLSISDSGKHKWEKIPIVD